MAKTGKYKKFTFVIEEYDAQASITKYGKIHSCGHNWKQAFNQVSLPIKDDYSYKLLTLNQFNALKRTPGLLGLLWEILLALWPYKLIFRR